MLKTNSKIAKDRVREYVLNSINDEWQADYNGLISYQEAKAMITDDFTARAYSSPWERRQNRQTAFIEFLKGLPYYFADYYYDRNAVELLGDMLEETEEERSRYSEDQAEEMLSRLIYREFII